MRRCLTRSCAFPYPPLIGLVEVDEHDHAGLRRHAGQGDDAHSPSVPVVLHLELELKLAYLGESCLHISQPIVFSFPPPAPHHIDGWNDEQREDHGGKDPADLWRGDPFHHIGAGTGGPHHRE